MALNRRTRQNTDIWPGFVDALSTLLIVIIFLLMIFVVSQLYLNDALVGRDRALDRLNAQIIELAETLDLEKAANDDLRSNVETLSADLRSSLARRDELQAALDSMRGERDGANAKLAEAEEARNKLSRDLEDAYKAVEASEEKLKVQLGKLAQLENNIAALEALKEELEDQLKDANLATEDVQRDLEDRQEELLASREETLAARAEAALLNKQLAALNDQIAELNRLLDLSEERDKESKATIEALGKRLNVALASKVQELARYRSEFFGRLRQILGNRSDVQIVGDRFVFQSEVLFTTGSADLGEPGQLQMASLAQTLLQIAADIPPEVKWILQVEGHTDAIPISTARFPSNWELSSARAISVVKFLRSQGIPAERLSATGYGEFQPLDPRNDEIANRRNRRIELKLTQR